MFYAWCGKLFNFGICRHHNAKFINHLFVKLIILYKPNLNVKHIQKWIRMILFDIPSDLFS
jgi:hypothetical protein